jgi:hypothetical protein
VIVDAVREVRPPSSPSAVVDDFAALLQRYRISKVAPLLSAGPSKKSAVESGLTKSQRETVI